jgi:putative transposase
MEDDIKIRRKRVAWLIKAAGISGVRPRKHWKMTIRIPAVAPAADLVNRDFMPAAALRAVGPEHHLPAHRRALGCTSPRSRMRSRARSSAGRWQTLMRASLVVDALQMALASRRLPQG